MDSWFTLHLLSINNNVCGLSWSPNLGKPTIQLHTHTHTPTNPRALNFFDWLALWAFFQVGGRETRL
jgi:hypothetical protein